MLSTPKFGAETGRLSECGRGYRRTATGCHQLGSFSRKNVPDAEIPLKLKIRAAPSLKPENVPDAEIRRSNSLKLKFSLPAALRRKCA